MHTSDIIGVGLDFVVLDRASPRLGISGVDFITDEERFNTELVDLLLLPGRSGFRTSPVAALEVAAIG
jgi:hypothetical protein